MFELNTYEDVEALYLALGYGCKCCGRLNAAAWYEASGDTFCGGCKTHLQTSTGDIVFAAYQHGVRTIEVTYDEASDGFAIAAYQRQEHERIHGFLPTYV